MLRPYARVEADAAEWGDTLCGLSFLGVFAVAMLAEAALLVAYGNRDALPHALGSAAILIALTLCWLMSPRRGGSR